MCGGPSGRGPAVCAHHRPVAAVLLRCELGPGGTNYRDGTGAFQRTPCDYPCPPSMWPFLCCPVWVAGAGQGAHGLPPGTWSWRWPWGELAVAPGRPSPSQRDWKTRQMARARPPHPQAHLGPADLRLQPRGYRALPLQPGTQQPVTVFSLENTVSSLPGCLPTGPLPSPGHQQTPVPGSRAWHDPHPAWVA